MSNATTAIPAGARVNGIEVRRRRIRTGLSVSGLAREIGCSPSYVSQIELGRKSGMSPERFVRLTKVLGIEKTPELIEATVSADAA